MSDRAGASLMLSIADRIVQAVELVAFNDALLWCAQRINALKKQGSAASVIVTWGGMGRYTALVERADGTLEEPPPEGFADGS